jgi:type IV secretory pathway VirB6-like protein
MFSNNATSAVSRPPNFCGSEERARMLWNRFLSFSSALSPCGGGGNVVVVVMMIIMEMIVVMMMIMMTLVMVIVMVIVMVMVQDLGKHEDLECRRDAGLL